MARLTRHRDNGEGDQEAKGRHKPKRAVEYRDVLPAESVSERRARAIEEHRPPPEIDTAM